MRTAEMSLGTLWPRLDLLVEDETGQDKQSSSTSL